MGTVDFNPRSPRGGATKQGLHVLPYLPRISIHAPREGERRLCPCGLARRRGYFNPRSPRGGATIPLPKSSRHACISIHAPREGERPGRLTGDVIIWYFNPRSPRGGATGVRQGEAALVIFQSTLPARGSDLCPCGLARRRGYFNPRSPRGGATGLAVKQHISTSFQSTLPARGSDEEAEAKAAKATKFQSTLPARGSDQMRVGCRGSLYHFNPRSPRGGATGWRCTYNEYPNISIHAPREGERLYALPSFGDCLRISIHAPREGERRG